MSEMRRRRHRHHRHRRHPPSPAAPPPSPLDDDDLLAEILRRLAPLPSSLPRASAVCKRWYGLASDPGFFRRFRLHHRRNPPLLGFFTTDLPSRLLSFVPALEAPNRISRGRFSVQFDDHHFKLLGSRHGLVLVFRELRKQVLVWDPVTAEQHHIAVPPGFAGGFRLNISGAVLRAAGDAPHFQVVLVVAKVDDPQHKRALACVYSSEVGAWGDIISTPIPPGVPKSNLAIKYFMAKPALLVENSLYWMLEGDLVGILEFDLERKSIAMIQPPVDVFTVAADYEFAVVRAEGGALGFLSVSRSHRSAQLWKRTSDGDGGSSWMLGRTIDLENLLSLNPAEERRRHIWILGFAEDNNMVVLYTVNGVFRIHLESLQFRRLPNTRMISIYHPFESVYAAEAHVRGGHDGAELLEFS